MKNQEQKAILLVEDETVTMMIETHLAGFLNVAKMSNRYPAFCF